MQLRMRSINLLFTHVSLLAFLLNVHYILRGVHPAAIPLSFASSVVFNYVMRIIRGTPKKKK